MFVGMTFEDACAIAAEVKALHPKWYLLGVQREGHSQIVLDEFYVQALRTDRDPVISAAFHNRSEWEKARDEE